MFWGCPEADGVVSQKQGTYWGLSLAKRVLAWPWYCGRMVSSGCMCALQDGLCFRGAEIQGRSQEGELGGDSEAPLHQMPDAALPAGTVLFRHCQGHRCESMDVGHSWRGDLNLWGDRPLSRRPGRCHLSFLLLHFFLCEMQQFQPR